MKHIWLLIVLVQCLSAAAFAAPVTYELSTPGVV